MNSKVKLLLDLLVPVVTYCIYMTANENKNFPLSAHKKKLNRSVCLSFMEQFLIDMVAPEHLFLP